MKKLFLLAMVLVLTSCSTKAPGVEISEPIWPYEFYKRFNLRTIISSYSNQLKYVCASYPREFYKPHRVVMPHADKVIIEDKHRYLSFELVSQDQVIIEDIVKNGVYHGRHLYRLYYNEANDDYRTDSFYIPQEDNCVELVMREDENASDTEGSAEKQ